MGWRHMRGGGGLQADGGSQGWSLMTGGSPVGCVDGRRMGGGGVENRDRSVGQWVKK